MGKIYEEIMRCKKLGLDGVLGTIISTEGSTYQKTGAKCFIAADGKLTGIVSGGCVEGDLQMIANEVIDKGKPKIVHYDFQDEGDLIWGLGVGCNGKMDVFLEPYRPEKDVVQAERIQKWFERGKSKILHGITVTDAEDNSYVGRKWLIDPDTLDFDSVPFKEIIHDYLENKGSSAASVIHIAGKGTFQLFYDVIYPAPTLAIFGGGPDAVPLVQLAKKMKWNVIVLDHRPAFANSGNFPEADTVVRYPPGSTPNFELDGNTYVVIMSHHFLQDQIVLKDVVNSEAAYIGLLGPRRRTDELAKGLYLASHSNSYKIHSPIGLDIGAETPEEIALSIISELIAVYRGGSGNKLTTLEGKFISCEKKELLI
ncbi:MULTISPECIES: XdhC family protein [unclassified Sporosarcina]|uniref:XdhC family protein n=1 Tax=unclassified Sporosarcina TaxID=2647733 RepID=UPI000C16904C|nr:MULTISPECIES: XdhC/CoxI family protein [unclassified Sporosarcina]PID15004.1 xanthine dehydrogenase [Sporosarcina sp. P34]PID25228.1 xanthine dehydrogenase [Sporosarcina sp. P7]